MKINMTAVGNLTADPELRYTKDGTAVANFVVACSERRWDKDTNTYVDVSTAFISCSVWRKTAENVTDSLRKGMGVVVVGTLRQHDFEDKNGERQRRFELEADTVAASLNNAVAVITRYSGDKPKIDTDPWAQGADQNPPF